MCGCWEEALGLVAIGLTVAVGTVQRKLKVLNTGNLRFQIAVKHFVNVTVARFMSVDISFVIL
jgi:hypothetical protein